jgi:NAD(P)H-flavin reductase
MQLQQKKPRNSRIVLDSIATQVMLFKTVDLAFIGFQYANFCNQTNCDFFKQLAPCLCIASLGIAVSDMVIMNRGRPKSIRLEMDVDTGPGRSKSMLTAPMSQMEAYTLVRDLIGEIFECGKTAVFELSGEAEFRHVSVQIYDWQQNPENDPRIDANVWSVAYALALADTINQNVPVSVTSLHAASHAMKDIRDEISAMNPRRQVLLRNLCILYQTAMTSLPDQNRQLMCDTLQRWAALSRATAISSPRETALDALVTMLPEDNAAPRSIEDNIDILRSFFDIQFKELLTGQDIFILDDTLMEWIHITWSDMKRTYHRHLDLMSAQPIMNKLLLLQDSSLFQNAACVLLEFRKHLENHPQSSWQAAFATFSSTMDAISQNKEPHELESTQFSAFTDRSSMDSIGSDRHSALPSMMELKQSFEEYNPEGILTVSQFTRFLQQHRINLPPLQKNNLLAGNVIEWEDFEREIPYISRSAPELSQISSHTATHPGDEASSSSDISAPTRVTESVSASSNKRNLPRRKVSASEAVKENWMGFGEDGNLSRIGFLRSAAQKRVLVIAPSISPEQIPPALIRVERCANQHSSLFGDDLIALDATRLAALLDEVVDIRAFSNTNNPICTLSSPLQKNKASAIARPRIKRRRMTAKPPLPRRPNARRMPTNSKWGVFQIKTRLVYEYLLHRALYLLVGFAYIILFFRPVSTIGGNGQSTNNVTFFGLPPQYDFVNEKIHRVLVPILYGVMHCNLLTIGLLPLTMCRWVIRTLSRWVFFEKFFHLENLFHLHQRLGFNLFWGVLVGAILWWVSLSYSCVNDRRGCATFNPVGNYVDIYNNLAAVLFLREVVVVAFLVMLLTSALVFPKNVRMKAPLVTHSKAYEIFYYTHLVCVVLVIALAFSSRTQVFYPTFAPWTVYVVDFIMMRVFNTKATVVVGADCFISGDNQALLLKVKKPRFFSYQAGQTAFLKVPHLSTIEWHPFSFASSPSDEYLEFLIDCSHGPQTWTKRLYTLCSSAKNVEGKQVFELNSIRGFVSAQDIGQLGVQVYGPCGSSFQSFQKFSNVLLIGGGSGLPSSLSVLRHLFNIRKHNALSKVRKVSFVWSTRHFESLLWCWGHLKSCIEAECGFERRQRWTRVNDEALVALGSWLDITIHVTKMRNEALNSLVSIERNSPVGSWLIHRLSAGRVGRWTSVFSRFKENMDVGDVKVFVCGPRAMVKDIRTAARKITSFHIDVSSENFLDK